MERHPAFEAPENGLGRRATRIDFEHPWERTRTPSELSKFALPDLLALGAHLDSFADGLEASELSVLRLIFAEALGELPFQTLRSVPPEEILEPHEVEAFNLAITGASPTTGRLRDTLHVVMKATRLCNLRCTYCNYWREGPGQTMSFGILLKALHGTISDPNVDHAEFIWHGGEPTLLGVDYYTKAVWLQEQFRRPGQTIRNRTQTNATLVSDDFVSFWKKYEWMVGVSIDGPPDVHDRRRVDRQGRATSGRAAEGLALLQSAGLDPRVLLVCDEDVVGEGAARIVDYLVGLGVQRVGMLNVVPENTPAGVTKPGAYLAWPKYIEFLGDVFEYWWPDFVDAITIRELADLAGQLIGRPPQICNFAGDCFGSIFTVEPTGEVAACDRYVSDRAHQFGSLSDRTFAELATGERMVLLQINNSGAVTRTERCRWFDVCHGGCPHDRELSSAQIPGWDSRCCGLAPLLDRMAVRISKTQLPSSNHAHQASSGVDEWGAPMDP